MDPVTHKPNRISRSVTQTLIHPGFAMNTRLFATEPAAANAVPARPGHSRGTGSAVSVPGE